jgi:prepilin peptidase CpaA
MTLEQLRIGAVLALAIVAVAFDVRTRRIPNLLTFGSAILALLVAMVSGGLTATMTAVFAWMLGVDAVYMTIFTAMAGGVIGLAVALARGYTRRALSNIWLMLMHWRVVGPKPVPGLTLSDGHAPRLAYAIPIAVGALCTLWRH